MEMFDTHRRDILDFDNYIDLRKPGFGGPASAIPLRDRNGKKLNQNPKLSKYQRTVERDPAFSHPVYDPTYKAMTHDLVYKQEGKKPFKYRDPYLTAVPVIEYEPMEERKSCLSFTQFINEASVGVTGREERIDLRGKGDDDAISDAEEKLFQKKIDWDDFYISKEGTRVDYMDADGDLVAYIDVPGRKLYLMPEAGTMSDEKYKFLSGAEASSQEDEDFEDKDDTFYSEEEADFSEPMGGEQSTDLKQIEDLLRSFEEDED
jgi:hypothetical protein